MFHTFSTNNAYFKPNTRIYMLENQFTQVESMWKSFITFYFTVKGSCEFVSVL